MADTKNANQEETKYVSHDLAAIHEAPAGVIEEGSLDPVYEAKARLLNKAIQDIGMGRYQWQVSALLKFICSVRIADHCHQLFIVIGFGWAMDNLWPIVTSLILPAIRNEFHPTRAPVNLARH
jgi:hypothetical protein